MRIEIRNDVVVIDGYVNAVARDSRPIPSVRGKFVEQIVPKAFERALSKSKNVDLLLNHDNNRKLGSTLEGNLELFEDNIGLRAICTVTDSDVIEKARNNQLRGWSFGFYADKDRWEEKDGVQRRFVEELELTEVSIIDNTKMPAYIATSIEARAGEEVLKELREEEENKNFITDNTSKEPEKRNEPIDYSKIEEEIRKKNIRNKNITS